MEPVGSQSAVSPHWKVAREGALDFAKERRKQRHLPTFGYSPRPLTFLLRLLGLSHPEAAVDRNAMFNHAYDGMGDDEHVGDGADTFFHHLKFRKNGGLGMRSDDMQKMLYSSLKVAVFFSTMACAGFNLLTICSNFIQVLRMDGETVEILFSTRHQYWLAVLVCCWEACAATCMLAAALYWRQRVKHLYFQRSALGRGEHVYYGDWHGYAVAVWDVLPGLISFSAVKVLEHVSLHKFVRDLQYMVFVRSRTSSPKTTTNLEEPFVRRPRRKSAVTLNFEWTFGEFGLRHFACCFLRLVSWKLSLMVIGFLAFIGKLSVTLTHIRSLDSTTWPVWCTCTLKIVLMVGLMNQLMFVIDANMLIRHAVSQVLFAGEDGTLERGEWDRQEVFMACVFRRIFIEFQHQPFKRAVALATFSPKDLQCMVLEEDTDMKEDPQLVRIGRAFARPHSRLMTNTNTLSSRTTVSHSTLTSLATSPGGAIASQVLTSHVTADVAQNRIGESAGPSRGRRVSIAIGEPTIIPEVPVAQVTADKARRRIDEALGVSQACHASKANCIETHPIATSAAQITGEAIGDGAIGDGETQAVAGHEISQASFRSDVRESTWMTAVTATEEEMTRKGTCWDLSGNSFVQEQQATVDDAIERTILLAAGLEALLRATGEPGAAADSGQAEEWRVAD